MEVLLQSRNRHDAGMRVSQMQARLFRLDRPRFHQNYAGDDLQAVDDPVLQLLEQHVLLPQQRLLFALQGALPRDVLHAEQNGRLRASLIEHLPRIQAHGAASGAGKLFFDVIVLHHAMLGYDFFQQQSKRWNVPLTVAQFVEQPALGVPGCHLEERIKRAARGYHAQRLVENQDGLADGVDNGLGERTRVCGVDELLSETVEFHKTSRATAAIIRAVDLSTRRSALLGSPQCLGNSWTLRLPGQPQGSCGKIIEGPERIEARTHAAVQSV